MCTETLTFRKRTSDQFVSSEGEISPSSSTSHIGIGQFTAKNTSPGTILQKHSSIDACKCLIADAGLESFIRLVVEPLDLTLPNSVRFNMNGNGRMQSWEDVYLAESVYTKCLGISKRIYQMHSYTHISSRRLAYYILEEHNERSTSFLPAFDFYVLVFCYYNEDNQVTEVDVQYDQLSFFLHCMGLAQIHAWCVETVITPIAVVWAKTYIRSGLVNPFTFMLQLILFPMIVMYCLGFLPSIV